MTRPTALKPRLPGCALAAIGGLVLVAVVVSVMLLIDECGGGPSRVTPTLTLAAVVVTDTPSPTPTRSPEPTDARAPASDTPRPPTSTSTPTDTPLLPTPTPTAMPPATPTPRPLSQAGATRIWAPDNSVMVYVPAGTFWMGSDLWDRSGSDRQKPQHEVYLDAFWIDRTEVTNARYRRCVEDDACSPPSRTKSYTRESYYGNADFDDYPVINVDWEQANAYCTWAGKRLPTEAEWEKAARGDDGRTYPWGKDIDCSYANYWGKDNGCVGDTSEVGSYPSGESPYGALDMAGNVWEWTSSLYQPYPYQAEDGREDPEADGRRVLRGGSWHHYQWDVCAADRYLLDPSYSGVDVGFRCARSGSEP